MAKDSTRGQNGLGTFAGVFTPSILTILGIILFLRLGYVVGNSGLVLTLAIIGLANIISVLTSFSLSAIATNINVKRGGYYYLISRTLGVEFGGAIGIVLFLAQSVSIGFYCLGLGEVASAIINQPIPYLPQIIAASATLFLFLLAWVGADLATRFQYGVMVFMILSLISFYLGGFSLWDNQLLEQNWLPYNRADFNFWMFFALFFPAVTGFTQGVSMSGDLRNPSKSLPLGTFLAVGISIFVYISIAIVFAASTPAELLATDYASMKKTAHWPLLIDIGVIAATLSSAMASFLGAPRILQALAADKILPFLSPFAAGSGAADNPRRAVIVSLIIALLVITIGKLDLVAQIVTMFFLISYGLLNYATFFEAQSASPSFRPRFRWYDKKLSLAGFFTCVGVMLAIDFKTALIAASILFAMYQYVKRTTGPARWADGTRSYHLQRVRVNLKAAAANLEHPRDWRPYILVMSNNPAYRSELLTCASWLEGGSGITTVVELLPANSSELIKKIIDAEKTLQKDILNNESDAFPLVIAVDDALSGFQSLVQSWGIGPIHANTLMLNWRESHPHASSQTNVLLYDEQMRAAYHHGCNIAIVSTGELFQEKTQRSPEGEKVYIDIWWRGDKTARLALLFAYLLKRNETWESAQIRLFAINYQLDSDTSREDLQRALDESRITALPKIIVEVDETSIIEHSQDAALVFLPFRLQKKGPESTFSKPLENLLSRLPITIAVLAAEDIDLDVEPEAGKIEEITTAIDNVSKAKLRLEKAEAQAAETLETQHTVDNSEDSPETLPEQNFQQVKHRQEQADKEREEAHKRVSREKAKLETALKKAQDLGVEEDS